MGSSLLIIFVVTLQPYSLWTHTYIKATFLPPNMISPIKPFNQGMTFESNYISKVMENLTAAMDNSEIDLNM